LYEISATDVKDMILIHVQQIKNCIAWTIK